MSPAAEAAPAPVASREAATDLLSRLETAMAELRACVETETELLAAGRLREGLAGEGRKAELSAAYLQRLRHAKGNVVALARFAPDRLAAFRTSQGEFERIIARNQTVIETARAVSESLMRSLAEEVERRSKPVLYGREPALPPRGATPLVFSARI